LPELGTVGLFSKHFYNKMNEPKAIIPIREPIRLSIEKTIISKRNLFKNDSISLLKKDSILLSIKILDKFTLIQQINNNKALLDFFKKNNKLQIVTETSILFPREILDLINKSDEYYLIKNKESTLSIELRKNNKKFRIIDFKQGIITNYKKQHFCWGQDMAHKILIFDLVSSNFGCSKNTHQNPEKTKNKTSIEIKKFIK
jgi:hypothetical protein